jgi:hypothetical protein
MSTTAFESLHQRICLTKSHSSSADFLIANGKHSFLFTLASLFLSLSLLLVFRHRTHWARCDVCVASIHLLVIRIQTSRDLRIVEPITCHSPSI